MDSLSDTELFARYLDICNRALARNQERFPYKQILGAAATAQRDKDIEVCIVDDQPQASFILHMEQGKITAAPREACGKCASCACFTQWRVPRSYLEEVVGHADEYIQNPARIDWDWMDGLPLPAAANQTEPAAS